jgi:hypothetical protein
VTAQTQSQDNKREIRLGLDRIRKFFFHFGRASRTQRFGAAGWRPQAPFKVGVNDKGLDVYNAACVLPPGKSIEAWVPFDPRIGEDKLKSLLKENRNKVGTWKYRCVWHSQYPTARTYERDF